MSDESIDAQVKWLMQQTASSHLLPKADIVCGFCGAVVFSGQLFCYGCWRPAAYDVTKLSLPRDVMTQKPGEGQDNLAAAAEQLVRERDQAANVLAAGGPLSADASMKLASHYLRLGQAFDVQKSEWGRCTRR